MKIHFVTIVLDGMPWITFHYPVFRRLNVPWHWHIVEGVAASEHCTSWCKPLNPRLSIDGTTEYLNSIAHDPRVTIHRNVVWHGKIEMVNEPLRFIFDNPFLLWEVDADELWRPEQIQRTHELFMATQGINHAQFRCRYFLGPDRGLIEDGKFGNYDYDWCRVWKLHGGQRFKSHEPPVIGGMTLHPIPKEKILKEDLVFDHMAYATEGTVRFKEQYYGRQSGKYAGAVGHWKNLQCARLPVLAKDYLPWIEDDAEVVHLKPNV